MRPKLEELRVVAIEERLEAELALGAHAELVPELERLVARHPLRDRLRGQLMLALYCSGRQAEALEVYQQGRRVLAEQLGLEPGDALQDLQRKILARDPTLVSPSAARPAPSQRVAEAVPKPLRGHPVLLAAAGAALVVAAAAAIALTRESAAPVVVPPNSVAVIDPDTNDVVAAIPVGESPGPIVAGLGAVWVFNRNDLTISRLDPARRRMVDVLPGVTDPTQGREVQTVSLLAAGEGALWTGDAATLRRSGSDRVDPFGTIDLPASDFWTGIATGLGRVWLAGWGHHLMQVDPDRGTIGDIVPMPLADEVFGLSHVAVGLRSVWVAVGIEEGGEGGVVFRYDAGTGDIAQMRLDAFPSAIAVGAEAVWVADAASDQLLRIRPRPLAVLKSIPVGDGPAGVAVGAGAVWTANASDGTVSRVDPVTNEVATIPIGHRPQGVTVANGTIWVSVRSG